VEVDAEDEDSIEKYLKSLDNPVIDQKLFKILGMDDEDVAL
jgi:hypothetical protein